ncbi:acyl-CoA dehydrogenase family protein [Paenibacillus beijingensis]|uniref:Acyl-CoA dehydrogenase n=1 Tax=Paenibacillus beijingensis TaxID=1126833 RepID=A0A0D5NGA8_9BACL|nr:acyl-CoA dehydrogenase family protein [Paenibacillus beijingensis]AJY74145.1 acyl-CoA dehydrogenase [Paenibacillus beijingensis]
MAYVKEWDKYIRGEDDRRIAALVDLLLPKFRERAARHDAEGSFPFENIEDLRRSGFTKLAVPREYGGEEISLYQMVLLQERLAYGDGSTALAVGWHMGLMLHYRTAKFWPQRLFESFCREVVDGGALVNQLFSEPSTGSPSRGGVPATEAERTDGGWLVTGRKTYSTLSPALRHFVVKAKIKDENRVGDFLIRAQQGVRVEETWNTLGMRATGSHDLVMERAFVPDDEVLEFTEIGQKPQRLDDGGGWLLHIPACYLGIAFAARDFALDFARNYKPSSLNCPIADLPTIRHQIGLMEADLRVARNQLYSAAQRWDNDEEGRADMKSELGLAKYVATNNAIQIVDRAMRIVGGASLSRALPLERLYRDVRAGLHNPPADDAVLADLANQALL